MGISRRVLDLNGIDATFHKLNAADYGATIANDADQPSTVTLDYQIKPSCISLHTWNNSKRGTLAIFTNMETLTLIPQTTSSSKERVRLLPN